MSVISEDSFEFEKVAGEFNGISPYNYWSVNGWDDEDAVVISTVPASFFPSQN